MINKTVYANYDDFVASREKGFLVGSSTIGTILGLNPHKTPLDLWQEYRLKESAVGVEDEVIPNYNASRGRCMEEGIARWFEVETGNKVIDRSAEIAVYQNSKYPDWAVASPDREVFAHGRDNRPLLEIKDTKMHVDMTDIESIPLMWFAQIQWQMGIMERAQAFIAINNGNKELQYRLFDVNKEYFEQIMAVVIDWHARYIVGDETPAPSTSADVVKLYPNQRIDKVAEMTSDIYELLQQARIKKAAIKKIDKDLQQIEEQIKLVFTDNTSLSYNGIQEATWREQIRNAVDSKMLKELYPEIYEKCLKETRFRKFNY